MVLQHFFINIGDFSYILASYLVYEVSHHERIFVFELFYGLFVPIVEGIKRNLRKLEFTVLFFNLMFQSNDLVFLLILCHYITYTMTFFHLFNLFCFFEIFFCHLLKFSAFLIQLFLEVFVNFHLSFERLVDYF